MVSHEQARMIALALPGAGRSSRRCGTETANVMLDQDGISDAHLMADSTRMLECKAPKRPLKDWVGGPTRL